MKELLERNNLLKPPKIDDIVEGKVIQKGRSSVFVDLGSLGTGIIYGKEFIEAKNLLKGLKIGDSVFAKITDLENEDGYIELSSSSASREITWKTLQKKHEQKEIIKVNILGANKGGLIAEISGIQAFLPVSQLSSEHYPRVEKADKSKILKALQQFIGKELEVKIFDLDPRREKLILSEKAKEIDKLKKLLQNYKVGDTVEGEITAVSDFGAFIKFPVSKTQKKEKEEKDLKTPAEKIPELEGLIHISELDWSIVEDPSIIVKVREKVNAKIIEITEGRISLSLKALKKDPWEEIEKKFKKGDVIKGKATKFNPFGAFVQITPKIQGLCHISEFGTKSKMEEKLEINKEYDFKILSIESKEHRMSLKLAE